MMNCISFKSVAVFLILLTCTGSLIKARDGLQADLYGFIRAEMIFDNSDMVKGDWLLYMPDKPGVSSTNMFTMTARHSRLGIRLTDGTISNPFTISGLLEVDFAGGFPNSSTAARQPLLRLRHAWLEMQLKAISVRIGQDWALVATPFPSTSSFVIGAGSGNLWMRYPQLALRSSYGNLHLAGSINRPMAGNTKYDAYEKGDLDPIGDGERSGIPWFMLRAGYLMPVFSLSISGHYGQENIPDLSGTQHMKQSWSLNSSINAGIGPFEFTGRIFTGDNLNSFFGGVFQGFVRDSSTVHNISSTGGWVEAKYQVSGSVLMTAGMGVDDPDDQFLPEHARSKNVLQYVNVTFHPSKPLKFLVEIEKMQTHYMNGRRPSGLRLQFVSYLLF